MAEGPSLHPKLQVASNIPIELTSQIPQDPARNLAFQMCQNPLVTPGSTMQSSLSVPESSFQQEFQGPSRQSGIQMQPGALMDPGLPTLRRLSGHPSHYIPSRPSVNSCFHVPIGCMPLSDKYVNKQTGPMASRKFRKERTVYSKEQQRLQQKHFCECHYPNEKEIVELALSVCVTKKEIKIWFKNNRAKYRRMNLQYIKQALPETNESSKAVSESTHFPGSIPVVASDNGESMYSGTFGEDSIPKLNCSQASSLHYFQACDGDMCCPQEYQEYQEYLLDGHGPVTAWNSGQSAAVESQTDLAVAEATVGLAYAIQVPEDAHNSGPCEDELWQRILEDLDTSDDWLTLRNPSTPVYTTEVLDHSRPYSHEEVCYTHL